MNWKKILLGSCPAGDHPAFVAKTPDGHLECKTCHTKVKKVFRFQWGRFLGMSAATFLGVFVALVVIALLGHRVFLSMPQMLGLSIGAALFACYRLEKAPD